MTGSKLAATGTVAVGASSNASISTVAVGIAMSSQVGLAGSVATNLMGTNVTASITDSTHAGADVKANNNVAVIAGNNDNVVVSAGALSISKGAGGFAGSMVTNQITGSTSAYISGPNTKVDALGTSSTDTLSVNSGTLAHANDLSGFQAPTDSTPDLSETQDTVRGLAVVASSHQAVVTNVASLAAGSGINVMVNPITSVLSGSTNAYISGASIDTRLTSAGLLPQIDVAASSFSYSGAFGAGIVPPTGTGGGGATIISTTMSRTTMAYITNSTVGSLSSTTTPTVAGVTVKANAEQDASSIGIGFNTGSVALNVFTATTEAYVDGGAMTASSLTVNATDTTGIYSAGGSAAYGSQAAVGGGLPGPGLREPDRGLCRRRVLLSGQRRRPHDRAQSERRARRRGEHGRPLPGLFGWWLALDRDGRDRRHGEHRDRQQHHHRRRLRHHAAVDDGRRGGRRHHQRERGRGDQGDRRRARDRRQRRGVGIGAAANVIVFKSQTIAESRNSDLDSSGAINVGALSTKEVLSYAVTAGIGGSVGIGATVGVIIIGTNTADADTQGQQTGQLDQRDSNGNNAAPSRRSTTAPQFHARQQCGRERHGRQSEQRQCHLDLRRQQRAGRRQLTASPRRSRAAPPRVRRSMSPPPAPTRPRCICSAPASARMSASVPASATPASTAACSPI